MGGGGYPMLSKLIVLTVFTTFVVTVIYMVTTAAAQVRIMAYDTITEPLAKAQRIYDETSQ
ncbi:hypothetical protein KDA08_03870 [Candidatus Saccharibacteria bacterium]|nr:hypothetical protein [Candidatus Saccharibacteria bacterium]